MNRISVIVSAFAIAASSAMTVGASAPTAAAEVAVSATASLSDGSTVKGDLLAAKVTGSTLFLKKLDLDPAIVKSMAFQGTNNTAAVELVNGDKFTMTVLNEAFAVNTLLGKLDIPRANIRSLVFARRRAAADGAEPGLVFYCTFDDEASVSTPAVGPSVKMELGQIVPGEGKRGGAFFVKPGIAGAQIVFPSGSLGGEGCIEFWANMASGKTEFSTGGDPRFFILGTKESAEIAIFQYASNDGCGNSGLGGHICGLRAQSHAGYNYQMPYSDIFKGEDYNGWHHYAFVWSPTWLAIYVDGKQLCRTDGKLDAWKLSGDVTMDIPLSREHGKSFNNKSAFFMDELKVWSFAKKEFDLF